MKKHEGFSMRSAIASRNRNAQNREKVLKEVEELLGQIKSLNQVVTINTTEKNEAFINALRAEAKKRGFKITVDRSQSKLFVGQQ